MAESYLGGHTVIRIKKDKKYWKSWTRRRAAWRNKVAREHNEFIAKGKIEKNK